MEVLLIRHGQQDDANDETPIKRAESLRFDGGWPDPELTALGETQAAALARRMAAFAPQRVLCSDLRRTRRTAELACAGLDIAIEETAVLREIHMGRVHRHSWNTLRREDAAAVDAWHAHREDLPYPGGECGADVVERAWPVLDALAAQDVQRAALFIHGGVIRALVCHALGLPPQRRFALGPFENTSVTTLRWDGRIWSLYASNECARLQDVARSL